MVRFARLDDVAVAGSNPEPIRRAPRPSSIASGVVVVLVGVFSLIAVGWAVFQTGVNVGSPTAATFGAGARRLPIVDRGPAEPTPSKRARSVRDTVITPAEAEKVLTGYWDTHESALLRRDLDQLSRLRTGSTRRWEGGALACVCYQIDGLRPLRKRVYFVPRQVGYPAFFIAEVQTESRQVPWVELLVFTKRAAGARWLVAHNSGFGPQDGDPAGLGGPLTSAGGYLAPVRSVATGTQRRRAQTAAANLAALWQQAKDRGAVPVSGEFDLVGQSLSRTRQLAQSRQGDVEGNGYVGHYQFFVDPDDPRFDVPELDGTLLTCQAVRETVVYQSRREGGLVRQDQARRPWGRLLEPGFYQSVTTRSYWQTCFLVPRDPVSPIVILNQDVGGSVPQGQ